VFEVRRAVMSRGPGGVGALGEEGMVNHLIEGETLRWGSGVDEGVARDWK